MALQSFKYVFLLAQLIMGAGGAPLYTLGTAFIDENVSHKMQPIYSGNECSKLSHDNSSSLKAMLV